MELEEVVTVLDEISKKLRGQPINIGENGSYGYEIDELIESVGFVEVFKNASIYVKIKCLSSCNGKNFVKLIEVLSSGDFFEIIILSNMEDLREILWRLLRADPKYSYIFWGFISQEDDYSDKIEDSKRLLLKKYLREFNKKKSTPKKYNKYISEEDVSFSDFQKLLSDYERLRNNNETLKLHIIDLEEKNKENIQNRIDKSLSAYVSNSVKELEKIEKKLKCAAARWSILSVFILFSGFAAGIGFALFGYMFGPNLENLKWPELLIFSIKGIFIVSAFVAAAGYSFMKSNAFTHEAIIVSNRAHAIQFGKLYLEIYGNTVERSEMQKIFENWNISSDTAFLKAKNDKSDSVKFTEFLDSLKKVKELIPTISKD